MRVSWKRLIARILEKDIPVYAIEYPTGDKARGARRSALQCNDTKEMNIDLFVRRNTVYIINRNAIGLGRIKSWV